MTKSEYLATLAAGDGVVWVGPATERQLPAEQTGGQLVMYQVMSLEGSAEAGYLPVLRSFFVLNEGGENETVYPAKAPQKLGPDAAGGLKQAVARRQAQQQRLAAKAAAKQEQQAPTNDTTPPWKR